MNLQTKAHGHISPCELQMHMVVMDLGHELCAVFLGELLPLQQQEAIICMRMNKKPYC
jgi:hypothetical protein